MKYEEFERLFLDYCREFWDDPGSKTAGRAIEITESTELAAGFRVLSKMAFKITNGDFYFHVGQVQVNVNKNLLFFIKEKDIKELAFNRWSYNPSYNFIYYEMGNTRKGTV